MFMYCQQLMTECSHLEVAVTD